MPAVGRVGRVAVELARVVKAAYRLAVNIYESTRGMIRKRCIDLYVVRRKRIFRISIFFVRNLYGERNLIGNRSSSLRQPDSIGGCRGRCTDHDHKRKDARFD